MALALLITLLAGLATSIGAAMALNKRMLKRRNLAIALSFSAGVMLFLSFMEILPHSVSMLAEHYAGDIGGWLAYGSFFVGIIIVALVDRLMPKAINPSEIEGQEDRLSDSQGLSDSRLLRSGLLIAVVLALHNFPEGMSTFVLAYQELSAGIVLAVAIALHNIPEGIAVAAPIYASTGSKKKAFWWASVSGLAEPLGALLAALLINTVLPPQMFGIIFGVIAGMMVFLALDELIPAAKRYQTSNHQSIYGILAGMIVVSLSIILLGHSVAV